MRHPDFIDRYEMICCDMEPAPSTPVKLRYACTKRTGHFGNHVAMDTTGGIIAKWENIGGPRWFQSREFVDWSARFIVITLIIMALVLALID